MCSPTDRLTRLGITTSSADRYRQAAIYREALPEHPPAELYGRMWTLQAALEFGKERQQTLDDLPDDSDAVTDAELNKKTIKRLQDKRRSAQRSAFEKRARKLIEDVREALRHNEPGVYDAIDQIKFAAVSLEREMKAQAEEADAHREEDSKLMRRNREENDDE